MVDKYLSDIKPKEIFDKLDKLHKIHYLINTIRMRKKLTMNLQQMNKKNSSISICLIYVWI